MNFQKTINPLNFQIIQELLPDSIYELTLFIERVLSDFTCPNNITAYLIHSNIEAITQKLGLTSGITKAQYTQATSLLLEFMHDSGMGLWFHTLKEDMSEAFAEYADTYLEIDKMPQDKDLSGELVAMMYYYITGVTSTQNPERIGAYTEFTNILNGIREASSYNELLNEYDDIQAGVSEDIMKSATPVDVNNLPDYIIESLHKYEGKYYKPSDIRKMITASSQTAQSLEREDLEPKMTSVGIMSAEDMGRAYIKKLKDRKNKKKEEKVDEH